MDLVSVKLDLVSVKLDLVSVKLDLTWPAALRLSATAHVRRLLDWSLPYNVWKYHTLSGDHSEI